MRLLKTHTHASSEHPPGDEIDVVLPVAEWLRTYAIGTPASPTATTAAAPALASTAAPAPAASPTSKA